jgi:starch synthase
VSAGLSIWHVARECAGLAEAGGVKDVVRGLAEAQVRAGDRPTVVLPLYGFLAGRWRDAECVAEFSFLLPDQDRGSAMFVEEVRVRRAEVGGIRVLLLDSPRYEAARDVYTYTARDEEENHWKKRGTGHWDVHQMNLALQRGALEAALALGERPGVFHCHDGHASFLPALLAEDPRYAGLRDPAGALVTVHNAGAGYHQEVWSEEFARLLTGLSPDVIARAVLHGSVDPFLAAAPYAELVTVSERYAEELMAEKDRETSGGLGRALREQGRPLRGITNGIDPAPWDPRTPSADLPAVFDPSRGDLDGKRAARDALSRRLPAPLPAGPLYAFVGRLTGQKGVEVLYRALERLLPADEDRGFVVLGTGEKEKESMLSWLAGTAGAGGRLAFIPRFDPVLASLVYAASDFFLVPSEYEPCGLTDFIAQIRGSIPVVHRVGGLVKVRDGETGFSYDDQSPSALAAVVDRTSMLFRREPAMLESIRRTGFQEIFSLHTWDRVYEESYRPLYRAASRGGAWTAR